MKRTLTLLLVISICFASLGSGRTESARQASPAPRLIVGYLPSFRLEHFQIKELEIRGAADRLTHILYAFTNLVNAHPTLDDDETEYQRAYTAGESVDGKADDPLDQ